MRYVQEKIESDCKAGVERAKHLMVKKKDTKKGVVEICVIDFMVYTKYRHFRAPGQCKQGTKRFLRVHRLNRFPFRSADDDRDVFFQGLVVQEAPASSDQPLLPPLEATSSSSSRCATS